MADAVNSAPLTNAEQGKMIAETRWTLGTNDDPRAQRPMPSQAQSEVPLDFAWIQDSASDKLDWKFDSHQSEHEEPTHQIEWTKLTFWLTCGVGFMLSLTWLLA